MKAYVFMSVLVLFAFSATAQAYESYESPTSSESSTSRSADNGGHPFVNYKNRNSLEALFDDVENDGTQVPFVTVANRSFEQNFNNYAELKRYMLSSDNIEVVRCSVAIGDRSIPVETYYNDGRFDSIIRRGCYEGEYLVLQNGHPVLSLRCGNGLAIPRPKPEPERRMLRAQCTKTIDEDTIGVNRVGGYVNSMGVQARGDYFTPVQSTTTETDCRQR